jgi:site-specific recombinase XerD
MPALTDLYIASLSATASVALTTLAAYTGDLRTLASWFPGDTDQSQLAHASSQSLSDGFALHRLRTGAGPQRITRMLRCYTGFFAWLIQRGLRTDNPCDQVKRPKMPRRLPIFLSPEECTTLLRACHDETLRPQLAARNFALVATALMSGLRISEVTGLTWRSIDTGARVIHVIGKGDKERAIPINDTLAAILETYRAGLPSVSPFVFSSDRAPQLSPRAVQKMLKHAVIRAGLSHKITPHKLRHTFATLLHQAGVDLLEIKDLLGHESISTTAIYAHTDKGRLASACAKISLDTSTLSVAA